MVAIFVANSVNAEGKEGSWNSEEQEHLRGGEKKREGKREEKIKEQ